MNYVDQKNERKKKLVKKKNEQAESIMSIHNEKILYFSSLQEKVLPEKILELEKKRKNINYSDTTELEEQIKDITSKTEETDYYLNTIGILEEYYLLDESCDASVMTFGSNGDLPVDSKKKELVKNYYKAINRELPSHYHENDSRVISINDCSSCSGKNCIEKNSDCFSCSICGITKNDLLIPSTLSFKESQSYDYNVRIDYKRINYFTEWLNNIQAKERTDIPEEVKDKIIMEIKKERISDVSSLNNYTVRRILKKIGCSKYYEHIPYIISSINGLRPLCIPEHIEEKFKYMFNEIQEPYERFKDPDRSNFFSYPYLCHKLCQILDLTEYLPFFPLLKSRSKLYKQDVMLKKVIEFLREKNKENTNRNRTYDINWRFIASV